MNLDYLRSFLEITKRGSFSEAAKALGLSQPAVTFQIQRLERELAVRLLERREGRVGLTPAGEAFARFAQQVMAAQEALHRHLDAITEEVSGRLNLAASTVPGEVLLPRILGDFVRRYPAVETSVTISDTEAVADQVVQGACDAGFVGAAVERRQLQRLKVMEDEIALIVPPSHPFAQRPGVRLEELAGEVILARESGSGTMRTVRQALQQAGFDWGMVRAGPIFGSTQALIAAVEAELGIAFVSIYAARKDLQLGTVCRVPLAGLSLKRDLYLVYIEEHITTRLLHEFLSFVENWVSTHSR